MKHFLLGVAIGLICNGLAESFTLRWLQLVVGIMLVVFLFRLNTLL